MQWFKWIVGILISLYVFWGRSKLLTWGALPAEINRRYPGDSLIPNQNLEATRAIMINAPKDSIWLWLAQMGRERTGFYSIDRLTNWNIPSVTYLRRDLPSLETGITLDTGLKVLEFEVEKYLLVGGFDLPNDFGGLSDFSYCFVLEAVSPETTRLIIRLQVYSDGLAGWCYNRIFELIDHFTTIAQLHGIKHRAEASIHPQEVVPIPLSETEASFV